MIYLLTIMLCSSLLINCIFLHELSLKESEVNFDITKQSTEIWATYIPTRRPLFKIYNKRHLAIASLNFNKNLGGSDWKRLSEKENKLYKLENGKWMEQSV